MQILPGEIPWESFYKIMIGSILPRPIGWISSIDVEGQPNLAPFSFFNAVCPNPPTVLFCPLVRATDRSTKDTLRNVRVTGEFVVNIVTEDLASAMNITSTEFPRDVNEFEAAGVTPVNSLLVKPFRVGESPVQYECTVHSIVDIGNEPGAGSVVIGRIVAVHIADEVLYGGDKIDLERLKPIGRLAGTGYCRVRDVFSLERPPTHIQVK